MTNDSNHNQQENTEVQLDPQTLEAAAGVFDVVRNGNTEALADLLAHGLPRNLTNDKGDTLLILAAYHCHGECVRLLVEAGAEIDRINDRGQTALGSAVFRQAREIVSYLLNAGANPDAGSPSAREVAAHFELDEMAKLLTNPAT